jgi:hypothetical protein
MDPYGIVPFKIIQNQAAGALLSQTKIIVGTLLEIRFYYRPPRYHLLTVKFHLSHKFHIHRPRDQGASHELLGIEDVGLLPGRVWCGGTNFLGPRIHWSRMSPHVSTIKADISGPNETNLI